MTLNKQNGSALEIELSQYVFTVEQQIVTMVQVIGVLIEADGTKLVLNKRGRRDEVYVDEIFVSEDEAKMICLKRQIATLKDNLNATQNKLTKKLAELDVLEKGK